VTKPKRLAIQRDAALRRRLAADRAQLRDCARLTDRLARTIGTRLRLCARCGWPAPRRGRKI
jgi:hypothetical protein